MFTALTGAATGLRHAHARAVPVRRGGGRGVPERREGDGAVVPGRRARPRAGGDARVRAARRGRCAPAATAYLIERAGWRWAFVVFGLIGVAWAVGFWLWFRDDPADAPRRERGGTRDRSAPRPTPQRPPTPARCRGARCSPIAAIIVLSVIMVFGAFYTYFFYSWFPKYLNASRGVENVEAGNLTSLVMAGSAVGMLLGGWLADRISQPRRPGPRPAVPRRGRATSIAAACLFLGVRQRRPARARGAVGGVVLRDARHAAELVVVRDPAGRPAHRDALRADERPRRVRGDGVAGVRRRVRRLAGDARADRPRRSGTRCSTCTSACCSADAVAWWLYRFTPLPDPAAPTEEETW